MKNQNEKLEQLIAKLGQVKSELNQVIEQLGRNEAIVKEEKSGAVNSFNESEQLIAKLDLPEKAFPRALPNRKKQYLYNEKLKQGYIRLFQKNPKAKALFYERLMEESAQESKPEKEKDKVLLGRGSCINAKQPPSEVVAEWEQKGSSSIRDRRRRRLKVLQSKPKPELINNLKDGRNTALSKAR